MIFLSLNIYKIRFWIHPQLCISCFLLFFSSSHFLSPFFYPFSFFFVFLSIIFLASSFRLPPPSSPVGSPPCRCGGLWAGPSRAPSCWRATPTSRGSEQRSGCSVTFSMLSRWGVSWKTSCSCQGGSACRFTDWEMSSAYKTEVSWNIHLQVYTVCYDHFYIACCEHCSPLHPVFLWHFNVTQWRMYVYMLVSILVFSLILVLIIFRTRH